MGSNDTRSPDTQPTETEWLAAWKEFNAACRKLGHLADRDGDVLKVNVIYGPGAKEANRISRPALRLVKSKK